MSKLEELIEAMRVGGQRITPQKRLIADYVLQKKCAVTAQEVLEHVHLRLPAVSLDTVYRNLNALCVLGVLCRVDKLGKGSEYEFAAGRHVHYITCTGCGKRKVFDGCAVDHRILEGRKVGGFRITGHKLDLYGLCGSCSKKGVKVQ